MYLLLPLILVSHWLILGILASHWLIMFQADSDDILDRAYYWRLNDFILQFYDDYETERQLELKNAGASRVQSEIYHFNHLNNADDILSNALYESDNIRYKGTGDLKKFRRGVRDGHLIIQNITIAEAGSYQCMVETAVGTIFATSNVIVHSQPGPPGGVTAVKVILTSLCTLNTLNTGFRLV